MNEIRNRVIGDHAGTTWSDFLVLPGAPNNDKKFTPDDVNISTDLAGVKLKIPFLTAAMRSVTGKDLALAAGKLGMMAVAPRGLSIDKEVGIVKHVKDNAVGVGEIELEKSPTTVLDTDTLGTAIWKAKRTGHSNIPVITRKSEFVGIFQYKPSRHDNMDTNTPITNLMIHYRNAGGKTIDVCKSDMSDEEIKDYLKENGLRFVPVIDEVGRLDRLVFLQNFDAYKVGAAIDTHEDWEKRAEKMIDAGADMIFIDTSDAHKPFSKDVVKKYVEIIEKYKHMGKGCPPICAGNIVTPEAFLYLAEAGADVIKLGMGPGSICTTNQVLGVGAPPFWSLIEVVKIRDKYFIEKGKYIPVIADGGIEKTNDIAVALTHADAIMGGKLFGCFFESEGERIDRHGNVYSRDKIQEENIVAVKIYGEGSKEARETTGDMKRYSSPLSKGGISTFQGISGWIPYNGRFKPGVESYTAVIKEVLYHVGALDLNEYRRKAVLIKLSERAKTTSSPHGIEIIND